MLPATPFGSGWNIQPRCGLQDRIDIVIVGSFYAHPAEHKTFFKVEPADMTTKLHRTIQTTNCVQTKCQLQRQLAGKINRLKMILKGMKQALGDEMERT